jgi:hypothetical protein
MCTISSTWKIQTKATRKSWAASTTGSFLLHKLVSLMLTCTARHTLDYYSYPCCCCCSPALEATLQHLPTMPPSALSSPLSPPSLARARAHTHTRTTLQQNQRLSALCVVRGKGERRPSLVVGTHQAKQRSDRWGVRIPLKVGRAQYLPDIEYSPIWWCSCPNPCMSMFKSMHVHNQLQALTPCQTACMPMLNCNHVHAQFLCMFIMIACIPMFNYMHVHAQFSCMFMINCMHAHVQVHACSHSIPSMFMFICMHPHVQFHKYAPCSLLCMIVFNELHSLVFEFHACPCMMMCLFMFQCILIFKFHHFLVTICLSHGHFVNIKAIYIFIYEDEIVWPYFVVPWLRIGQPRNVSKTRHGMLVCLCKFSLHIKQLIEG